MWGEWLEKGMVVVGRDGHWVADQIGCVTEKVVGSGEKKAEKRMLVMIITKTITYHTVENTYQ